MPTPCPYILILLTPQRAAAEGGGPLVCPLHYIYGHGVGMSLFDLGGPNSNIPILPSYFRESGPLATTLRWGMDVASVVNALLDARRVVAALSAQVTRRLLNGCLTHGSD